jgi:hypothetical protein
MEHAVLNPALKPTVASLVGRIPWRKIGPRSARSQHPEHAVQHLAGAAVGAAALRRRLAPLVFGEVRLEDFPLLVGEVHPQGRSENRSAVDPHRLSDRVSTTYAHEVMRCALAIRLARGRIGRHVATSAIAASCLGAAVYAEPWRLDIANGSLVGWALVVELVLLLTYQAWLVVATPPREHVDP